MISASEFYLFASSFVKGADERVQLLDGYRHGDGGRRQGGEGLEVVRSRG